MAQQPGRSERGLPKMKRKGQRGDGGGSNTGGDALQASEGPGIGVGGGESGRKRGCKTRID